MKEIISMINFGNLLRVISALGMVVCALVWYNRVKDRVLGNIIKDLGKKLTFFVFIPFCLYGIGEIIVVLGQASKEASPNFILHVGRLMRMLPALAPLVVRLTKGNFFWSILTPAGLCIFGWGFEYIGKILK